MSKPRYKWWGYVKAIIRDYPRLAEQRKDIQQMRITANYGTVCSPSESSRGTEQAALQILHGNSEREFQAVNSAIMATKTYKDGEIRLQMLNLIFWKQSHTLQGAALKVHVSGRTARRWHTEFIRLVASFYGLLD